MKARISAMMDGELDERSVEETVQQLERDGEAAEAWQTYHLISDAMRDSRVLSEGFSTRFAQRLATEPTVLAPGRLPHQPRKWYGYGVSAAASLAAVALVGWLAFGTNEAPVPAQALQAKSSASLPSAPPSLAAKPPAIVPLPLSASDYLLAHQGFSPRVSLQGVAPYVRTVSEPASGARK